MTPAPCPLCSSPHLVITSTRECTVIEEVEVTPEGPVVRSRRLATAGRHVLPARAACLRCGHAWWVAEVSLPIAAAPAGAP